MKMGRIGGRAATRFNKPPGMNANKNQVIRHNVRLRPLMGKFAAKGCELQMRIRRNIGKIAVVPGPLNIYYRCKPLTNSLKVLFKKVCHIPDFGNKSGYRLINLQLLGVHMVDIAVHCIKCSGCHGLVSAGGLPIRFIGEVSRWGLASVIQVICQGCGKVFKFNTSERLNIVKGSPIIDIGDNATLADESNSTIGVEAVHGIDHQLPTDCGSEMPKHISHRQNVRSFDVNVRCVWGQMSVGGGKAQLDEMCSCLDMPCMKQDTFSKLEMTIGKWWEGILLHEMAEAAKVERQLAIDRGDFHEGIPAITVVADGGWAKRSHRHTYSALGGVAIIVGALSGKLLHVGVRNKHCQLCALADNKGNIPIAHDCYQNWSQSSQAMEADILLDGFSTCEEKYGLRYMRLIGDGDSSVMAVLHDKGPYWCKRVEKLECANHACKCLRGNLEKLVADSPKFKGKGKLTKQVRIRLTAGVRCAIRMRGKMADSCRSKAIKLLERDIRNSIYHVLGDHQNCSDFCKKREPGTVIVNVLDDDDDDVGNQSEPISVIGE